MERENNNSSELVGLQIPTRDILEALKVYPFLEVSEESAKRSIRRSGAEKKDGMTDVFELLAWIYKNRIKKRVK